MPLITEIPPEVLKSRHRFSAQQINSIFGKKVIEESIEEKAGILARVAEFLKISDLFRAGGIQFIPCKGPLLSYRLYGDATVRKSGDLDILIDPVDIDKARECLLNAGYSEYMSAWPAKGRRKKKALKYWHHIAFRNPEGEETVELHWKLTNRQWLNFRDADEFVRGNLCTVEFAGNSYRVLNPEAELLYLVIHGGAHRWGMLKWLEDIHRYIVSISIDQDKFCSLVNQFDCGRLVTLCNKMLSGFFPGTALLPHGTPVSRYMEQATRGTIISPSTRGPENLREIFRLLPYALLAYPGLRYQLKVLNSVVGSSFFNGRLSRLFD